MNMYRSFMTCTLCIFIIGCASPAYEKDPDFIAAHERVEASREAYEAAQAELKALRAKKEAEEAQMEAEAELEKARAKTKTLMSGSMEVSTSIQ